MTTQNVLLDLYDYGASTPVVTVSDPDTLVLTDTADTVTQSVLNGCRYVAAFVRGSVLPAGVYAVGVSVNGIPGLLYCTFAGVDGETVSARLERAAVLDSGRSQTLADLGAMITGSGTADAKFGAMALSLAPAASGGLTTEQDEALMGVAAAITGGSKIEASGRVAAGGKVTAYAGDDFRVRSRTALTIPVSDPAGSLYTKLTTITIANLRFAVSAPGKTGSLITGTISGITTSGSGADRLCLIAVEITNCGASLPPGEQYFYQVDHIQNTSDDFVEVEGKFLLKQRARAV